MEWNLKGSSWDLGGIEEATLPNIETMEEEEESNRFGKFSVDLKLGQVENSVTDQSSSSPLPLSKDKDAVVVSKMASPSSSGSSKRARAINNTTLSVSCLVDGCNSDLSNCRDYHRRHKVCELHSKTPEVTIGGLKQRFHSLDQFDERKRSCRKRLDGHNKRRRKPQPEPITRPAGSFLSNYQGTQLLPFSSSTTMVNSPWSSSGLITSCESGRLHIRNNQQHQQLHVVDKQDHFLGSTTTTYGEGKQLQFLHNDSSSNNNPSLHNQNTPLLRTSSKMFCDSLTTSSVHESPCALSLLSSSQTHTSHSMVQQPHSMSLMQPPLGLSLHGNNNNSFESMDRVLVPNGSESDHCSSLYNIGSDGSQSNDAPQLFPYQWE
ncbi:hypothetical protein TSUD_317680 [Trifolium subterraneum]|uniref:SBP-type domain-containing protein n=1 Tax=Trifolium subterraneum TaxID=3900 RepID=A0A2Z6MSW3_TRISU|nr:hypothetical protein TSUD_317680 [Trifolium subterraneum]